MRLASQSPLTLDNMPDINISKKLFSDGFLIPLFGILYGEKSSFFRMLFICIDTHANCYSNPQLVHINHTNTLQIGQKQQYCGKSAVSPSGNLKDFFTFPAVKLPLSDHTSLLVDVIYTMV